MEITYTCVGLANMKPKRWEGNVRILSFDHPYECSVSARGSSFQVILGSYEHGNYICIPNYNIGCDLACLSDTFWNMERLASAGLSIVDALSISDALCAIDDFIPL